LLLSNEFLANLSINPIPIGRWQLVKSAGTAAWMAMGATTNLLQESILKQISSYETIESRKIVNLIQGGDSLGNSLK